MSDERNGQRRRFAAQEKVAVLRQHLVEKAPVSEVCDQHGLNPTAFYRWQKEFFENGAAAFEGRWNRIDDARGEQDNTISRPNGSRLCGDATCQG